MARQRGKKKEKKKWQAIIMEKKKMQKKQERQKKKIKLDLSLVPTDVLDQLVRFPTIKREKNNQ